MAESQPDNRTLAVEIKPGLSVNISTLGLQGTLSVYLDICNKSYDSLALKLENVIAEPKKQLRSLTITLNDHETGRNELIKMENNKCVKIRLHMYSSRGKPPPDALSLQMGSIVDLATGDELPLGTYKILRDRIKSH